MKIFSSHSEQETITLGMKFSTTLGKGDVVALFGDLGTGKTRFIKGICKGLGVHERVMSPTFTILREYAGNNLKVYHWDFYRITSASEIDELGFEETVNSDGVCLIEWADRVRRFLPPKRYDVHLDIGSDANTREITFQEIVAVA